MSASLAKDSGLRIDFSGEPTKNSGEIEPPKNGNPPKDLIKFFDNAFAKVFERFLAMGNADIEKRQRPGLGFSGATDREEIQLSCERSDSRLPNAGILQSQIENLKSKINLPGWRNWQTRQT